MGPIYFLCNRTSQDVHQAKNKLFFNCQNQCQIEIKTLINHTLEPYLAAVENKGKDKYSIYSPSLWGTEQSQVKLLD